MDGKNSNDKTLPDVAPRPLHGDEPAFIKVPRKPKSRVIMVGPDRDWALDMGGIESILERAKERREEAQDAK